MEDPQITSAQKRVNAPNSLDTGTTNAEETIECPLCAGKGTLSTIQFYEKLGVRDHATMAKYAATEAVTSVTESLWTKYEENLRARVDQEKNSFDARLRKLSEDNQKLSAEKQVLQDDIRKREEIAKKEQKQLDRETLLAEKTKLNDEIATLKGSLEEAKSGIAAAIRTRDLEVQKALATQKETLSAAERKRDEYGDTIKKMGEEIADLRLKLEPRKGKVEERSFEEEVEGLPKFWITNMSTKKGKGDFHIGLYTPDGEQREASKIVIDNKKVGRLTDNDLTKLARDTKRCGAAIGVVVVADTEALRPKDKSNRFGLHEDVNLLRTTREWFIRDLDFLEPLMKRQASEGPDFLKRNKDVAEAIRANLTVLDEISKHARLARENAEKAEDRIQKFRVTILDVCSSASVSPESSTSDTADSTHLEPPTS